MRAKRLNQEAKISKVFTSSNFPIEVSIRTLDVEQTEANKQKALRLYCRAMIRLYLQDHGHPENGKSLGIL